MKWLLSAALFLTVAVSANAPPAGESGPASAGNTEARMRQDETACVRRQARIGMEEHCFRMGNQEHEEWGEKEESDGPEGCDKARAEGPRPFRHCKIAVKLMALGLFAGFSLCGLFHLLLTVLVFNDMRARKDINGLWIPVVLIGGPLAIIAYGLFRKTAAALEK